MNDASHFADLAKRAAKSGRTCFTRFLEPAYERDVLHAANENDCTAVFWGGTEDAERRIAAFCGYSEPESWEYPISILRIRWNAKFAVIGHRDLLGAVMGLGIERDAIGDICMGREPGTAYLFCAEDMRSYIMTAFTSAGRASVRLEETDTVDIAPPEGTQMRVTIQNPRLDSVLAAGCRLSRSEAQKLITQGLVKLNHVPELRTDVRMTPGDLISARGYGRLKLEEITGETKKGRTAIQLFRYGK